MHFLLIGASGRTGQLVTSLSLSSSHTLTALVRNPDALPTNPNLTIIKGTPLQESDIVAAIKSSPHTVDAVIFTLGSVRASESPFAAAVSPPTMMTDAMRNTLSAMRTTGVGKIICLSSVGTGESWGSLNMPMKLVFSHTAMKFSRKDHDGVYELLKGADGGIKWTSVRPWMLQDGEEKEVKVYGADGSGAGWMPKITKASVARFLVRCAEGEEFEGKAVVIAN